MKLLIAAILTISSLSAFAKDCSDINNLTDRKNCVVQNNRAFVDKFSDDKPTRALTQMMRGCEYKSSRVSVKTSGNGCSYHAPCLLLRTEGAIKTRRNSESLENVELAGFRLKFARYRISCD